MHAFSNMKSIQKQHLGFWPEGRCCSRFEPLGTLLRKAGPLLMVARMAGPYGFRVPTSLRAGHKSQGGSEVFIVFSVHHLLSVECKHNAGSAVLL